MALGSSDESAKTPQSPKPETISINRLKSHLCAELATSHADILLLTCCIISGLVDSTVYNAYGTFVSMQTGNTIFLGLGGATPHSTSKPYGWVKSFLSITSFCLGCFVFSLASRLLTPLRRSTLTASFVLQSLIIVVAAAIIQGGVVNGSLHTITADINWRELLPIALLSFQSAGQIVGSRVLGFAEVPTVVLTSMLHDISTDPALLGPLRQNMKRNRRILAFAGILAGAVAGGFISESTKRMQVPLWIAGGIKFFIASAWIVWPEKETNAV
ncbi:hypothetical protein HO133_001546 [Letharia lupina]|uniref:DUF1275 domain protein n=1 Tax=Letharia lupina TaxID=560253 RepID=A0A8H6CFJ6_9LECA|nr:uncharacterized protein HO133_001546 [Letharia lupina]KAF6222460.1 hypothetical protein HO133_001546 [Letharia lupina]